MGKFRVRIIDHLYVDREKEALSKNLVSELKKLEAIFPKVQAKSEEDKEEIWLISEELRKATFLDYPVSKRGEIQARLWKAQAAVQTPLKEYGDRRSQLLGENELLTKDLKKEIVEYLEKSLEEVQKLKSARIIDTQKRFVDRGNKGEMDIEVRTVEDNHSTIETLVKSLVNFRFEIRNKTSGLSYGEILERVREFEAQVNSLDVNAMEKKEVSESEWREMRANGMI